MAVDPLQTLTRAEPELLRAPPPARMSRGTTVLFAATAFVGAALLFVVQPMVARIVLPAFGGAATVWSTSSLFFQLVLLLGYVYVHLATNRLSRGRQIGVHVLVLLVPLLVLPVSVPGLIRADGPPVLRLLAILILMIGLPFAVLSTTGPLLQRWYSWTPAVRSDDPYFLFAASNLGSFGGLLAYPVVIEPTMTLDQQRLSWSGGFVLLVVLVATCAVVAFRAVRRVSPTPAHPSAGLPEPVDRPARRSEIVWFGLAFLPSALLLAVTSHISTDVAAVPLLWVIPLAVYLATFVLAFARRSRVVPVPLVRAAATVAALALAASFASFGIPIAVAVGIDVLLLALVGFVSHARLAALRPSVEHMTRFYLIVALGGAAGGFLNGVVAPLALDRVWEYPGALVASVVLGVGIVGATDSAVARRYGRRPAMALGGLVVAAAGVVLVGTGPLASGTWWMLPLVAAALLGAWWASGRPWALGVGMTLLVVVLTVVRGVGTVETVRTFYGAYRVTDSDGVHRLQHGNTAHGSQLTADPSEPTLYYARTGPLGQAMSVLQPRRTAVIGLGTGTIAAYGRPGDSMTFYEIDPEIIEIARDPRLFTYLRDSKASVSTVAGDGRLELATAPDRAYDLIVLDAFSSDAVPVHLLTAEAFDLYASKLAPGGSILVHISNRYLDLEPVVAASADHLGWSTSVRHSTGSRPPAVDAEWVMVTPTGMQAGTIRGQAGWRPALGGRIPWTDDYSSVLSVVLG